MINNYLKIFLLLVVGFKLNGQTFEKVQPEIYILNSCSKQAHISIEFKNTYEGFEKIKDSLEVVWLMNDEVIQKSTKKYFYATKLGNYSCEVWHLNIKISSNKLEIKEFRNSRFYMFLSPPLYSNPFSNICTQNEYLKQTATNTSGYFFGPPSPTYSAKYLEETNSDSHFNWYVNDKLQNHPKSGPILNGDSYLQNIRLEVSDGQCEFISNNTELYNYSLPKKGLKKYEFCSRDTTNILMEQNWNNYARKFIWYNQGQIFSEKIDEANFNIETYAKQRLRTTLPGNYILKTIYAKYTSNGNYIFDENSCSYWSDSVFVTQTPIPTASISGNNAIELGQTADLKFDFTSTPPWQMKLSTGEEFSVQKSPFSLTVKPSTDMKYSIYSVKNICGLGTTTGEALIKVIILADEQHFIENIELKAYPIPVYDAFEVEIKNAKTKQAEIYLYDYLGKIVMKSKAENQFNSLDKTLNISNLSAGLYILKVNIDGKIIERKILKK